jgi:hypothetical protein
VVCKSSSLIWSKAVLLDHRGQSRRHLLDAE